MKNYPFSLLVLFALIIQPFFTAKGQTSQLISDYLNKQQEGNSWSASDIKDWVISDQYFDRSSAITYSYIQQRYQGINVLNAVSAAAIRNNMVVNFSSALVRDLESRIKNVVPVISAENAIRNALRSLEVKEPSEIIFIKEDVATRTFEFKIGDLSERNVTVQLVYQPAGNEVLLCWNVSIDLRNSIHWWNVRIDAVNGNYIEKNSFTVECNFGEITECNHDQAPEDLYAAPAPPMPPPPSPIPVYNVFALPFEAPGFGQRQILVDPADAIASPYGWHDDNGIAGNEYTTTKGNNIFAYTDADNNNAPDYVTDGGLDLRFNFLYHVDSTPLANRDAALTQLFYVNNKIHDVLYHFGFDELAGNFQKNNYGQGGLGNDFVNVEEMDGGGNNNANINITPDGTSPRMQTYLFNITNPNRDVAFDNVIVMHEYTHGLSTRLTGGPANPGCLGSKQSQAMGEGWSDYVGILLTMEQWDDGADWRADGTWSLGQPPTGNGFRVKPYSTNMTIDPLDLDAYGSTGTTSYGVARNLGAHNTGAVWCSTLWDMTWNLIDDFGKDLSFTDTTKGNYIALRLVVQAMKLQTCNPGFMDARNAILKADTLLYGGIHVCRIWQAFARRGFGFSASQGASSNDTIVTPAFDLPASCNAPVAAFKSNVTSLACGNTVVFTDKSQLATTYSWNFGDNTTSTLASPTHVYASQGTYNVKQVVSNAFGSDSVIHTISAIQNPVASFYIVDSGIVAGEYAMFKNTSSHGCTYYFNFGDGNSSNSFDSVHTYTTPGDYVVKLVVTNSAGSDSITHTLHVDPLPFLANFYVNKSLVTCNDDAKFTNTTLGFTSLLWDFGDGSTSTATHPSHQFTAVGSYNVKLVAYNNSTADSIVRVITIQPPLVSAFATPNAVCAGSPVQLIAGYSTVSVSRIAESIPYAPVPGTGTAVTLTNEQVSASFPIGFNFDYYGIMYSTFKITSNGYINFNATATATYTTTQVIPDVAVPNNCVYLAWADLNPANPGGSINYFTTGTAPARKLVVNLNLTYNNNTNKPVIGQVVLYETSNIIEFHIDTISVPTTKLTVQGMENITGTAGVAIPGRNKTVFTANNEGWRLRPNYSFTWMPGNLTGNSQTVNPVSSTVYTVVISDISGCSSSATALVNMAPPAFSASASATPSTVCMGNSVQLTAASSGGKIVESIPYAPVPGTGTAVTLANEQVSASLPIGFNFDYYGIIYSTFKITSNGYINFNATATATYTTTQVIPDVAVPNNCVYLAWADLNPANPGSSINYFTTGIAPNRKLVVNLNLTYNNNTNKPVTGQVLFYETTNVIEFHIDTISVPSSMPTVQGIENSAGTSAVAIPGRNKTVFTANNEGWRFREPSYSYSWLPGNLQGNSQTVSPVSSTVYTAIVSDPLGCSFSTTVSVSIAPPQFSASASATPSTVCMGDSIQLTVASSGLKFVESIPYSPVSGTGTPVILGDDDLSVLLPIGFTFDHLGNSYSDFKISSNGYISFNSTDTISYYSSQVIPDTASPNNCVYLAWGDLNPLNPGSYIDYFTTGIAPDRKLVVNYNVTYYSNLNNPVIGQLVLYETSNVIEFHIDTISVPATRPTVQGIENSTGTIGAVIPGRNKTVFTANNEGWRFRETVFSYSWLPGNLQGNSQTVFPSASTVYTAVVANEMGCQATAIASVTVNPAPPAAITPAGPTTFCAGGSVALNANTGSGLSYQWKKNSVAISGATNASYTATAAGAYSVVVANSCGTATSPATTVTIKYLPIASITAAGPTTFCSGGNVLLNAVVASGINYQWKKNGVNIAGATLSSYTATTGGTYKVTVTNASSGCSKTTGTGIKVTINAKPPASLTPQGPTTFCIGDSVVLSANTGAGLTYKWKKGGIYISGATLSNYTAKIAGNYNVEVTNSNGCTKLAVFVTVTVPCKEGESILTDHTTAIDFSVYPNPNSGIFTIEFSNQPSSTVAIELTDNLGKVVSRFETNDKTFVIKESELAEGTYLLTARNKDEIARMKIMVVK